MNIGPPNGFQRPQANVQPNPSSNNDGQAASLAQHAMPGHVAKFHSNLGNVNGNHHIGSNPNAQSLLAGGFLNRGFHHMEQTRKPTSTPNLGAGTGVANPNKDRQRTLAKLGKSERVAQIEAHKGAPKFRPPMHVHKEVAAKFNDRQPKAIPAHAFGAKSMKAASTRVAPNMGKRPNLPIGAKAQFHSSSSHTLHASGGTKLPPHPSLTAQPKVMPHATKGVLGLPSFKKGIGAPKPQPARQIHNAPSMHGTKPPVQRPTHYVKPTIKPSHPALKPPGRKF